MNDRRYIWCGEKLELEIDQEFGRVRLDNKMKELEGLEFKALVALVTRRGQIRRYLELVPEMNGYDTGNRRKRAQNVVSQIDKKLDGWLTRNFTRFTRGADEDKRGYRFDAQVRFGNSPNDRELELPNLDNVPSGDQPSPTHRHGGAADVVFWSNFHDRKANNKGVEDLIKSANKRVIITGALLNEVAWQIDEIKSALSKVEVLVGLIMATPKTLERYAPYSKFLKQTYEGTFARYEDFCSSLSASERKRFALCYTDKLQTHSIGLYDNQLYVSEFCINQRSVDCPSFSTSAGSETYAKFLSEVQFLLNNSRCYSGKGLPKLLRNVNAELRSRRA
jgi:hypothetical protein